MHSLRTLDIDGCKDTESRIILALACSKKPLLFSEVARQAHITTQLANYHIPRLVKRGLLIRVEKPDYIGYITHPCFSKVSEILNSFQSVIHVIADNIAYVDGVEPETLVSECLSKFIGMFIIE